MTLIQANSFLIYPAEILIRKLTFAIQAIDSYTGKNALYPLNISISINHIRAYKNQSGYFIFTDLKEGIYSLLIESDFFFPVTKQIDTSYLDPKNPLIIIQLIPKPSYQFPENTTLVRGILYSVSGPVENASIKAHDRPFQTFSDERGEFAIFFNKIRQENIQLNIEKNSDTKIVDVEIKEGKTIYIGKISFP